MKLEVMEKENYYGHQRRLSWINERIREKDEVIEVGCGTGSMITIPLNLMGKKVVGIDIADVSIDAAKRIAKEHGIGKEIFFCKDVSEIKQKFDVVILSEVLEHIEDGSIDGFIDGVCSLVKRGGKLIVTVPNGNGSYERGQKYWKGRIEKFEQFLQHNKTMKIIRKIKNRLCPVHSTGQAEEECSMSFSNSPHVQFFKYQDIVDHFSKRHFTLKKFSGSAMFSGVIINTYFTPPGRDYVN